MQVRTLAAATLVSLAALASTGAFAQDSTSNVLGTTTYSTHSDRTREAVVAELRATQARGQWHPAGEVSEAPVAPAVLAPPAVLTRAQVKAEVAQARVQHQLPRAGELL
jgi:hypothetical protein